MTDTSGPRIDLNPGNGPDYEVTKSPSGSTARDKDLRIAELEKAAGQLLAYYENSLNAGPGPRPRTEAALLHNLRTALQGSE